MPKPESRAAKIFHVKLLTKFKNVTNVNAIHASRQQRTFHKILFNREKKKLNSLTSTLSWCSHGLFESLLQIFKLCHSEWEKKFKTFILNFDCINFSRTSYAWWKKRPFDFWLLSKSPTVDFSHLLVFSFFLILWKKYLNFYWLIQLAISSMKINEKLLRWNSDVVIASKKKNVQKFTWHVRSRW